MTERCTTTPGVQLEFDLVERAHVVVGPTFGEWYRAQPAGFDDDWANSRWPGRVTANYRAHLDRNGLASPLTNAGTSTHGRQS